MGRWTTWIPFAALAAAAGMTLGAAQPAGASPKSINRQGDPARSTALPRVTPESKGISSRYLLDLINEFEKRNIELHSLLVAVDGQVVFEGYYNPYNPDDPYIIHSLTKIFTNAAAGIAFSEGRLKFTDKVVDYFPDRVPKDASANLKAMTFFDLITMRSGHGREISGNEWRPLKTSWLDAFMKEPVPYKPGTRYQYSSGNSYLVSAMVQKAMGMTAEDVIREKLVRKLGMARFSWQKSPEGINPGGNGIMVTPMDLLKVGILYQQKGMWQGERLLTEEWCDYSLGYKGAFNDGQIVYNLHWWNRDGILVAAGVFGQEIAIIPELNMVVGITAGTAATSAEIASVIKDTVVRPTLADPTRQYDGKYTAILKAKGERLNLLPRAVATDSPLAGRISGRTFRIAGNVDGISEITLAFSQDRVTYTMKDPRGTHTVVNGLGSWITGSTTMTGNYLHHQYQNPVQKIVASARWVDDHTLQLDWTHPEMAFRDLLTLKLTENTLSMVRSVNINSKGPFGGLVRPEVNGTIR
jgi:CubicO group peptidase (beta-lactamase class C family)